MATPPRPSRQIADPPVGDLSLNLALRRIGFQGEPNVPGQKMFAPAPAQPPPSAADISLKRREWILDVVENQRALSARAGGVPRVRGLSSEEFLDRFYAPGRPVVIEREMDGWPALKRWTPDYLRRKVGDSPVEFQAGRAANPNFELDANHHKKVLPFGGYLDLIESGSGNEHYITANKAPPIAPRWRRSSAIWASSKNI